MFSQRILVLLYISLQVVLTKKVTYKAGVVEYGGKMVPSSFKENFFENVREYRWMIKSAAVEGVDIVVFPEATLNHPGSSDRKLVSTFAIELPDPKDKVAPCRETKYSNELTELSCAIKDSKIYAVLHVIEKVLCKIGSRATKKTARCPDDGFFLYSSNVVFDREGRIISRYRKTHLFGEQYLNKPLENEVETFNTDFGVTFGHMICFDSMFSNPLQELLKQGVKNFVLPVMWFSELPFLTAIQFQSALAHAHNVNLLLSGASLPSQGSTGSGIFSGKSGIKTAIMTGTSEAKLIVADLYADAATKSEESFKVDSTDSSNVRLLKDHLQHYDWNFVDHSKSSKGYSETVCSEDFCCSFYIKTTQNEPTTGSYYHYAMVAFDGVRDFSGFATGGVQNCGLVACTTEEFSSCGTRFPPSAATKSFTTFKNVKISGTFQATNATQFPVSLGMNLLPFKIADSRITKVSKENGIRVEYELTEPHADILSFGIFGRYYSNDGQATTKKSPVLESARKARNLLVYESNDKLNSTQRQKDSRMGFYLNTDEMKEALDETVIYVWEKMRIILLISMIYVLEMM